MYLVLRDVHGYHADGLVADPADCVAGLDVGAGDCTTAEGLRGDRVRLGRFVRRVVRGGLMESRGRLLAAGFAEAAVEGADEVVRGGFGAGGGFGGGGGFGR